MFTTAKTFNGEPDETDLFPLGGLGYLTQTPLYLGASFETGNVWNDRSDIILGDLKWSSSLFVGADTLIGPVYLGGGIGSKGEAAAFLYIGQLF